MKSPRDERRHDADANTSTLWPLFAALRLPIMRGSEAPAASEEYPRRVLEGVCRGEAAASEIADELQRHGVCICSSGLDIATILRVSTAAIREACWNSSAGDHR